jgi:CRP-like cAMP-binding protein/DNA-binding NarL/FixJ family response regulator
MKKILLIQEEILARDNTKEIIELSNYCVIVADNGKVGLSLAVAERPDLIICDTKTPVLDGFGVLYAIQKNDSTKHIPFIFLASVFDKHEYRKAMDLGADDFIAMPLSATELLNSIDGRFRKADMLKIDVQPILDRYNTTNDVNGNGKNVFQSIVCDRHVSRYKRKENIYSEGNHAVGIYYIIEGRVKTYRTNDIGKSLAIDVLKSGDIFGYITLFDSTTYKDNAVALEKTEVALISKVEFESLLNNNPKVAQKFIQLLASNIAYKEERLLGLAFDSLRKKVAVALVTLLKKYANENAQPFSINISRDNLASIAGTATESLVRTLSDFKNEKLIDIGKDGTLSIINEQKLHHLLY